MAPTSLEDLAAFALPPIPQLDLPALPQITNPDYYEIVTTHSSLRKGARSPHELNPKVGLKDYEKLEHVGDALVGAVVAVILHDLFPMIGEGPASMLKGQLVSNAILAQISERYGLPSLLRTDPCAQYIVRKQVKSKASMFEAWVAGVYYTALEGEEGEGESEQKGHVGGEDARAAVALSDIAEEGAGEGEEGARAAGKGKESAKSVRFREEVDVEMIEEEGESSDSPEGSEDEHEATGSLTDSASPSIEEEPSSGSPAALVVTDDYASNASAEELAAEADCPFAQLLLAPTKPKFGPATPTSIGSPTSISKAAVVTPAPVDDTSPPIPVPTSSIAPSASLPLISSDSISRTDLAQAQRDVIRLRWLAMCVLDDWLRPIFTPLAVWAMSCLRAEQVRICAARTKAYMDVDALDAKTKGCLAILNGYVMAGEAKPAVYEVEQVEDGWKVRCRLTRADGVEFTAESTRTAKRPAQNIATWRVIVQLGLVEDPEELAAIRAKQAAAGGAASESGDDDASAEKGMEKEAGHVQIHDEER